MTDDPFLRPITELQQAVNQLVDLNMPGKEIIELVNDSLETPVHLIYND